ncbi:MAG: hypothetical protein ONB44_09250 [candidate division KSB1 bacterium]|nr:hypothetical protein [candidate division KSB1 bacterium]MDZ7311169.1 hypothetical protein [candidate division KSB1 bacterium]
MSENTSFHLNQEMRLEILLLAYEKQIDAIINHNELSFKVFSWSTTLLLALVGYVMTQNPNLRILDRLLLSIATLVLFSMTFWWQKQNFVETTEHGQNVEKLHQILHLTEPDYFVNGPVLEREIHMALAKSRAKSGLSPYNLILLVMTIVALSALWTR